MIKKRVENLKAAAWRQLYLNGLLNAAIEVVLQDLVRYPYGL
ncbi:MAG: hypothetical protein ACLQBD_06700 [Syntrophobacteraceae bacterium]